MSDEYTPSVERVADLYAWAYAWRVTDGDDETDLSGARERQRAEFYRWRDKDRAEAQVEALRELARCREELEAATRNGMNERGGSFPWNAAKGVRDYLYTRADRIAREAGIETGDDDD